MITGLVLMVVSAVPGSGTTNEADGRAIVDVVRPRIEQVLGKRIYLSTKTLRREGDWAFLIAAMQDPHGRPLSYVGTPRAEAAAQGLLSRDYVALLRHNGDGWAIVVDAIGPTDMVWATWPQDHGAPDALFRIHGQIQTR